MKKLYTLLAFLASFAIIAQAPQGFNYQATVRNAEGALIANQNVNFKFNLMLNSQTAIPTYSESHNVPTDDLGQVNLTIGAGTASTGTFSMINWGTGNYYLGIEINTGTGYVTMGTTQLLSVPYALYANSSGSAASNLPNGQNIGDSLIWDGTKWTVSSTAPVSSSILCKSIKFKDYEYIRTDYIYKGNKFSETHDYYNDVLGGKTVFYYTGDLITLVKSYDSKNNLDSESTVTYNNSGQIVSLINLGQETSDGLWMGRKSNYTYNPNGTITESTYTGDTSTQNYLVDTQTYTILDDEIVKIERTESGNNTTSTIRLYDTKNSPFKNVTGIHWYFNGIFEGGSKHNIIQDGDQHYEYTYNSDNYPLTQWRTNCTSCSPTEYTY